MTSQERGFRSVPFPGAACPADYAARRAGKLFSSSAIAFVFAAIDLSFRALVNPARRLGEGENTPRGERRPQLVNGIPSARVNSRFSVCGLGSLSAWPIFLFSVPVRYLAGAAREKLRDASFVSLLGFKEVSGCCVSPWVF